MVCRKLGKEEAPKPFKDNVKPGSENLTTPQNIFFDNEEKRCAEKHLLEMEEIQLRIEVLKLQIEERRLLFSK